MTTKNFFMAFGIGFLSAWAYDKVMDSPIGVILG